MKDSLQMLYSVIFMYVIMFYIWFLTVVNLVNRKSCGCKTNSAGGITTLTVLALILAAIWLMLYKGKTINILLLLVIIFLLISAGMFIAFYKRVKQQNCLCYRKYKGQLTALYVIQILLLIDYIFIAMAMIPIMLGLPIDSS
jgi:hypothetical protein